MKITFLGAAEGVTGSDFLVEAAGKKFLVDCRIISRNKKGRREKLRFICI